MLNFIHKNIITILRFQNLDELKKKKRPLFMKGYDL